MAENNNSNLEIDYDKIGKSVAEALSRNEERSKSGRKVINFKDLEDLKEQLHNLVKGVKEAQPGFRSLSQIASGAQVSIQDNAGAFHVLTDGIEKTTLEVDEARKAFEALGENVDKATARERVEKAEKAQSFAKEKVKELAKITVTNAVIATVGNFANAMIDNTMAMRNIAYDFKEGLIAGTSATDLYSQSSIAASKANSESTSSFIKNAEMLTGAIATIAAIVAPFTGGLSLIVAGIAGAATVGLSVYDNFQKKNTEIQNREIAFQAHKLKLVDDSFKEVVSTGGVLAQGMTELVYQSQKSGFTMKEFSAGLKASKDAADHSGRTFDDFTRIMASTGAELHKLRDGGKNFATTLNKLGYSGQEQLELQADVIAQLQRSSKPELANNFEYVAQQTVELGKSYKVLNAIVGENSREAMKKHREEAAQANLVAKYGSDEISQRKLQYQLAAAERGGYSKLYKEILNYGHAVSADTIIQQNQNRSLTDAIIKQRDLVLDSSKGVDTAEFKEAMGSSFAAIGEGALEFVKANKSYVEAMTLGAEKIGGPVSDAMTGLSKQAAITQTFTEQINAQLNKNVSDAANNNNKLDKEASRAEENRRRMAKNTEGTVTELGAFAKNVADQTGKFNSVSDNLIGSIDGLAESITQRHKDKSIKSKTATTKLSTQAAQNEVKSGKITAVEARNILDNGSPRVIIANGGREFLEGLAKSDQAVPSAKPSAPAPAPATTVTSPAAATKPSTQASTDVNKTPPATTVAPTTTSSAGGSTGTRSLSDIIKFNGGVSGDEAHFRQAEPALQGAFVAMAQEYYAQTKKKLHINSSRRSFEEQQNVKSTSGMKAIPGTSLHERGLALDLNSNEVAELSALGLLNRYKFNTLAGDPMHIQMADKGAELRPGEMSVVGENGPEIVGGPGTVKARNDTAELFATMNSHLEKLVRIASQQKDSADRLIRVMA